MRSKAVFWSCASSGRTRETRSTSRRRSVSTRAHHLEAEDRAGWQATNREIETVHSGSGMQEGISVTLNARDWSGPATARAALAARKN